MFAPAIGSFVVIALAACGPAVRAAYAPAAMAPRSTPIAVTPAPVVVSPTPPATIPSPVIAPTQAPMAQPVAAQTGTFPIVPFGTGGAFGTVRVTVQGAGFAVAVSALGLVPGSRHSVHLHAGSCSAAIFGRHLLILGTMVGNDGGAGGTASRLSFPYSAGRYVIIYANLSPATIIGCADLGAL